MAKTVKDVKDKILDYLYDLDFEKATVSEFNGLSNMVMLLTGVSNIRENTDDVMQGLLSSIQNLNSHRYDDYPVPTPTEETHFDLKESE